MKKTHYSSLIIHFLFLILLSACSIQKKIGRSAKETVTVPALQTAHVGISIYEPATGKYWYNYQGDHYFVPASNTKIPTCYAAMKYLGDSLVGILYKETNEKIDLVGTGDPTFLHPDFIRQPVFAFLQNKKAKQVWLWENVPVYPLETMTAYGSGWSWDDYNDDYMAERSFFPIYGNVIRFSLEAGKVTCMPGYFNRAVFDTRSEHSGSFFVKREPYTNAFFVSAGNRKYQEVPLKFGTLDDMVSVEDSLLSDTLHKEINFGKAAYSSKTGFRKIYSQPTDSLLKPMMHRSDNFFAEQSLLMVSDELLGFMNNEKIIDTLLKTDFKDLPQKPSWVDGSGLSRYNLFSPQDLVAILNKMKNDFGMERIRNIFETGGTGTISNYYKAEEGTIFGKTGTLSGVVAFSGFLYTKKGKLLIFSTLVNNHNHSATEVRRAIEKFLEAIRSRY